METFAVLFDMDGLMLDTERMARRAWTLALAEHGLTLDEEMYLQLIGRTPPDVQALLLEMFGQDMPFQNVYNSRQANYNADIELNGVPVKTGVVELLGFLEENNIPKAVATSTPSWFAEIKLGRAGLAERFQVIVCGDQVARGKPEPDIFLETARQIGFPPERCIVLEDSEAGIIAADRAGMLAVMVPDLKPPTRQLTALAYRVLPSLHEVIPLLRGFLKNGLPLNGRRG